MSDEKPERVLRQGDPSLLYNLQGEILPWHIS